MRGERSELCVGSWAAVGRSGEPVPDEQVAKSVGVPGQSLALGAPRSSLQGTLRKCWLLLFLPFHLLFKAH